MRLSAIVSKAGARFAIAVSLLATTSAAASAQIVAEGWARATPPGASVGAVYLSLKSKKADRLVSVSTAIAARAMIHQMSDHDGMMMMAPMAEGLSLPPGQSVTMLPGGDHIMLEDLKAPLKKGDKLALHLQFDHAAPMDIVAPVEGVGASGPQH